MNEDEFRFCPSCGSAVTMREVEGRQRRYCTECDTVYYRNPKPCAGTLVVDGRSVLLVQRTEPPSVGSWSVPAGFLEHDEPPRRAAVRELREETGLSVDSAGVDLFDTTFVPHQGGTHVLVVLYAVSREHASGEPRAGSDAGGAEFWAYESLTEDASLEPGYTEIFRRAIREYGRPE